MRPLSSVARGSLRLALVALVLTNSVSVNAARGPALDPEQPATAASAPASPPTPEPPASTPPTDAPTTLPAAPATQPASELPLAAPDQTSAATPSPELAPPAAPASAESAEPPDDEILDDELDPQPQHDGLGFGGAATAATVGTCAACGTWLPVSLALGLVGLAVVDEANRVSMLQAVPLAVFCLAPVSLLASLSVAIFGPVLVAAGANLDALATGRSPLSALVVLAPGWLAAGSSLLVAGAGAVLFVVTWPTNALDLRTNVLSGALLVATVLATLAVPAAYAATWLPLAPSNE